MNTENQLKSYIKAVHRPDKRTPKQKRLPAANVRAIELLDQWLAQEVQEPDANWEKIAQLIDENRLSSRKLFS